MDERRLTAFFAACATVFWAVASYATVAIHQSNKDLAEKADEIVRGTVKDRNSYTDAKNGRIYTLTTVTVSEWIKGGGAAEVTVRQLGGKIGDRFMVVSGDASMETGEEVVLFLMKGDGVRHLHSLSQSKFHVTMDKSTGKKIVRRDLDGLTVGQMDKDGVFEVKASGREDKPVPLTDFIAEIKGYLSNRK
jgi:hypothetical protein